MQQQRQGTSNPQPPLKAWLLVKLVKVCVWRERNNKERK
jgi:hypothetical protein